MARKQTVPPAAFSDALVQMLHDYTDDVKRGIAAEVEATGKEAKQAIKDASPVGRTKSYKRGWRVKKRNRDGSYTSIVHNATDYQIVHLLEHGHAKRGGGRVRAIPHVGPVADRLSAQMERNMRRIIENGGRR